ncbi:MAG: hypothetical protein V7641_5025 [Blastocatellia bacterium]
MYEDLAGQQYQYDERGADYWAEQGSDEDE